MGRLAKGAGLMGLAAAAAATYFLYGKRNAGNRRIVRGWMLQAKGEVLDAVEKAKELTEEGYHEIVDRVTRKYRKVRTASEPEIRRLNQDMKAAWSKIASELKSSDGRAARGSRS